MPDPFYNPDLRQIYLALTDGDEAAIIAKLEEMRIIEAAIRDKIIAAPATEAKQDTGNTSLAAILAKIIAAPATEAKQDTGNTSLAAILAKIIAAPATEAKQDTIITSLNGLSQSVVKSVFSEVPTDNAVAYAIGDNIGGIVSIAGVADATKKSGMVYSVTLIDESNTKPALEIHLYSSSPNAGSNTNNAAQAINSADYPTYIGKIVIASADWTTMAGGSGSIAQVEKRLVNQGYNLAATTLYACVKTLTAITFGSTTGLDLTTFVSKD